MTLHFLNCFTCNARVPSDWRSGTLCLLIETDQGLVLVDTGPGRDDYVHRREYKAFTGTPRRWTDLAYVRRHIAHQPVIVLYADAGQSWLGLDAIRLPFELEMWLVPLFGHTRGHCGIAIRTGSGWLFHVGDAAPMGLAEYVPDRLVRFVLGPHAPRLRAFGAAHPQVRMTTGHMWLDFFQKVK